MAKKYDVIVAGGGASEDRGSCCSSASWAKTLLLERYGFLGGNMTHGLPFVCVSRI